MHRLLNLTARVIGFAWIGVVAFVISPPARHGVLLFQAIAYAVAGLGLIVWGLVDFAPWATRFRRLAYPAALGLTAAMMGAASASGVDGGMFMVAFAMVAAMVAGGDADLTTALGVAAAGILGTELSGLVRGASSGVLIGFPVAITAGLLLGRNRGAFRIQAEQAAALLAQREQLEAEQRRADLLDERARIAREIHDVLAHSLGALGVQIQAARSVLTDYADIDKAVDLLASAQRMAAEGLMETRRAVYALRTDTLPLADEIAKVATVYGERYHVTVSLDTDGDPRPVPPDATVALLRVAQEALVNAAKYGTGKPVAVRLAFAPTWVRLTVKNEVKASGQGTKGLSTVNAGYGLTGMAERLRLLNGTLAAGPEDTSWVVTAEVPLAVES